MRFVPIKTAEQQAVLMLHRTRDLLVRQRTMLVNALRGHMAELGIIAPQGIARAADLIAVLFGEDTTNVPALAGEALRGLAAELEALDRRVKEIEVAIVTWHKDNEASRRLATIPVSGRSRHRRSSPLLPTLFSSTLLGTLRPGSGWCPDSTVAAANSAKVGSPNRVIATCADCLCWVQPE